MAAPLLAGGGTGEMGVSKNVCYEGRPYEKNGAKGKRNLRSPPPPPPPLLRSHTRFATRLRPLIKTITTLLKLWHNNPISGPRLLLEGSQKFIRYGVRVLDWYTTTTLEDRILFQGFLPWGAGVTKPRELTLPPRFETCFCFLSWALSRLAVRASSSPELRRSTQTSPPTVMVPAIKRRFLAKKNHYVISMIIKTIILISLLTSPCAGCFPCRCLLCPLAFRWR